MRLLNRGENNEILILNPKEIQSEIIATNIHWESPHAHNIPEVTENIYENHHELSQHLSVVNSQNSTK